MSQAFEIIEDIIKEELTKQGFSEPVLLKEEDGDAHMYSLENVAYSVKYDKKRKNFILRSCNLSDGKPGEWKSLSSWLYDEKTSEISDAKSIGNDFLDIIKGPAQITVTKKQSKKNKNEDRTIDPLFFFNRLVSYVPELKTAMNNDRIEFGKIRFAKLTEEKVVPAIENLFKQTSAEGDRFAKLVDEMYKDGELDVRALLVQGIINNLSDTAYENLASSIGEDTLKSIKIGRRLKGKVIKAEKPKKKNKFMANAMENAKQLEKEREANSKGISKQ